MVKEMCEIYGTIMPYPFGGSLAPLQNKILNNHRIFSLPNPRTQTHM